MIKRLTNINPLQAGKVLAALYFGISLLFIPFFLVAILVSSFAAHAQPGFHADPVPAIAGVGVVFLIFVPLFYAILGFVGGALGALIYNLVAKFTGGLEMTFVDVAPSLPVASHGDYLPR